MFNQSLMNFTFEGNFYGARECSVVCDRNKRVIMVQLYDDRVTPSKLQTALFSDNWTAYDFINGKKRDDGDERIAHQVRRRNRVLRIDTELSNGSPDSGEAKARVVLMMPDRVASMLLQANKP